MSSWRDCQKKLPATAGGSARLKLLRWLMMLLLGTVCAQSAYAGVTVTPVTWNVIGLDSNNPNVGPNTFQVGARVCNTGATSITNVAGNFVWDSSNSYINLSGSSTSVVKSLSAGACVDMYFQVTVTRTSLAYDTTRRYHITVSADNTAAVSTPTPRELYVERIISQGRNSTVSITGPSTVYVGQTYTYTLAASTATQGYDQLEAFLSLSNVIFQVQSIATTYSAPAGATNDKFYSDACGWDNNPLSSSYRSCIGPANYPGGKAGGTINTTYTVKILSAGTTTAGALILDFSGSSYHYNSDFGSQVLSVTSLPPPLVLSKTATPSPVLTGRTVTYTLRVTNSGTNSYTLTDFIDTPSSTPARPTYVNNSSTFGGAAIGNPTDSGTTLTWAGSFPIPAGQSRDLTYQMVMPNVAGTYTNRAIAHFDQFQVDTTNDTTDNAPAAANVVVQAPPNITLTKSVSPLGTQLPGAVLTYTIQFTNSGGLAAANFVLIDPDPANTSLSLKTNMDFKLGSVTNSLGTTGLTLAVAYSSDGGASYAYIPVSGGGGAPVGYDRNVTHIRWTFTGNLSPTSPNNTGSIAFSVRIR
ncbi:MAG: hypothetical protein ABR577_11320 [Pyrinomonadaceae bacterium]